MPWLAAVERVILTAWIGALWSVGYLAAPVLFASLDNRALAGQLAGNMFTKAACLSILAAIALLLIQWRRGWFPARWRSLVIVVMLALIVTGELWVRPMMATAAPPDFGRLHGLAQGIYLVVSVLGLALAAAPANGASPAGRSADP